MERPIGYWVKNLDNVLEGSLDRTLASRGVGRRHWQTLNLLAEAPRTVAEATAELAPFLGPGEMLAVLAELERLGWVAGDPYTLTADGTAALESLRTEVTQVRQRATEGLSEDDYRTTVATLRRMAENLA
ncbi:MarR family transcriptional regulator [Cryptosporangium japonicum]|uniref:MarR family winged helix-turn-helix transcriptional regulator n=1 Tax=Cryptosporangium japonicum TaxID=80872 RepID=A0ABN0V353_9ACTN